MGSTLGDHKADVVATCEKVHAKLLSQQSVDDKTFSTASEQCFENVDTLGQVIARFEKEEQVAKDTITAASDVIGNKVH